MPGAAGPERAAPIEKDEDHGRAGQGDQSQGEEVGDQMEINTHGPKARKESALRGSLRVVVTGIPVATMPL